MDAIAVFLWNDCSRSLSVFGCFKLILQAGSAGAVF